ncbi:suppressor of glycerol defect [Lecanicillium sp. MT-2017a]|nr:suppressor of glycerol defect [Lecanicillium sp. MT-2017a]
MPSTSIPELQQKLFNRMGIEAPVPPPKKRLKRQKDGPAQSSRKDQRRAQRAEKKARRANRTTNRPSEPTKGNRRETVPHMLPNKSQNNMARPRSETTNAGEEPEESLQSVSDEYSDLGEDDDFERVSEAGDTDVSSVDMKNNTSSSKARQDIFAEDDAEIAAFEKKLGIKKGRKSLPQAFQDDGLDELLGNLSADSNEKEEVETRKRKRDYDDWLSSKREKAQNLAGTATVRAGGDDGSASQIGDLEEHSDVNSDGSDVFSSAASSAESDNGADTDGDDLGLDEKAHSNPSRRENPYVAPTEGRVVSKYVPPSLRKATGSESEQRNKLQRSIQGQINRLTDANILSIIQAMEDLYQKNARGDVTELITNIILAQVCKPENLPDQFFVLTGGFTAALYKIMGSSFGSHVVRRVVEELANDYQRADKAALGEAGIRKEACNLINFLAQLYVFEVIGCRIIFDYMERFLVELSELNVELLLRVCRMAGRMLRRDDPQALKHIAGILNTNMQKKGIDSISVRTKFMVETINDLKNSKPKGKGLDSAIVSEHVIRMKKRIGELKSQSRRLDGLAPMGVSLGDIEGADTKGKWWLVGASVPAKSASEREKPDNTFSGSDVEMMDDEDMDFVLPDYPQKARAQGFNSAAQIAIFSALMSATSNDHAYKQYLHLKLKRDEQLEIVRVLVQCVGSETEYNEFYALVAAQACGNNRLRFAFQDRLWKIFRGLGESLFGEEADDEETADSERMKDSRRLANVARFYAALVSDGSLTIGILKPLELPELNTWTVEFMEWFISSLLRHCKDRGVAEDDKITQIFGPAKQVPGVAAGLYWFLRKKMRKNSLMEGKDAKKLERVRQKAQATVQGFTTR